MRAPRFKMQVLLLLQFYGFYTSINSFAQDISVFDTPASVLHINKLSVNGTLLNNGWKFKQGDDMHYANPGFNDARWQFLDPTKEVSEYRELTGNGICWLRLHLSLDSNVNTAPVYLHIQQNAASEIYLDGKLFVQFGTLSNNNDEVQGYNPLNQVLPLLFNFSGKHVIAIRICLPKQTTNLVYPELSNSFFYASMGYWSKQQQPGTNSFHNSFGISVSKAAVFIIILLLHFAFYFFYRKEKVNLWLGVFDLFTAAAYVLYALLVFKIHDVQVSNMLRVPAALFFTAGSWFLLPATYSGFAIKKGFAWWFFIGLMFVSAAIYFTPFNRSISNFVNPQTFIYPLLVCAESIRLSFLSLRKKSGNINPLARVMIFCVLSVSASVIALQVQTFGSENLNFIFGSLISVALLGLPISFFMYVATEFRFYYNKLVRAQELRNKIALDLHDDLGTKLSTARMFLRSLKGNQISRDAVLLENSINLLDASITDLRHVMNDLHTSTLIEKGYVAATEELVNKVNDLREINFTLSYDGLGKRLEQKTEYNLYRITQELINNTLKYANAKNVLIELVNRDDKIIFMYEDDGRGFDIKSPGKGFGLSNITARSHSLNAEVEFDSKPGAGFRTIIEFPLAYA